MAPNGEPGFRSEALLIWIHARKAWELLPPRYKWAFGGVSVLMAIISACNTLFPILLGQLVDELKFGADNGFSAGDMHGVVARFLALVGCIFLVREILQVGRGYLVENTCYLARAERRLFSRKWLTPTQQF